MNEVQVKENKICKTFGDKTRLKREVMGTVLFSVLSGDKVPQLVTWDNDLCVTRQVQNARTYFESSQSWSRIEELNQEVARFIAEVYFGYRKGLTVPQFLSWDENLLGITNKFIQNRLLVISAIGQDKTKKIMENLLEVRKNLTFKSTLTLIHGDLHLDNILVNNNLELDKLTVIDFEHCMEAPIEMEFQNSLFWNDSKSLDVLAIKKLLREVYKIPYSTQKENMLSCVYIANQLNMAIEEADENKLQMLVSKM
jgi:hypothetical protein